MYLKMPKNFFLEGSTGTFTVQSKQLSKNLRPMDRMHLHAQFRSKIIQFFRIANLSNLTIEQKCAVFAANGASEAK